MLHSLVSLVRFIPLTPFFLSLVSRAGSRCLRGALASTLSLSVCVKGTTSYCVGVGLSRFALCLDGGAGRGDLVFLAFGGEAEVGGRVLVALSCLVLSLFVMFVCMTDRSLGYRLHGTLGMWRLVESRVCGVLHVLLHVLYARRKGRRMKRLLPTALESKVLCGFWIFCSIGITMS